MRLTSSIDLLLGHAAEHPNLVLPHRYQACRLRCHCFAKPRHRASLQRSQRSASVSVAHVLPLWLEHQAQKAAMPAKRRLTSARRTGWLATLAVATGNGHSCPPEGVGVARTARRAALIVFLAACFAASTLSPTPCGILGLVGLGCCAVTTLCYAMCSAVPRVSQLVNRTRRVFYAIITVPFHLVAAVLSGVTDTKPVGEHLRPPSLAIKPSGQVCLFKQICFASAQQDGSNC